MKINILLPYKEKFDKSKASSVSITIKNNLFYTKYLDQIKIYGQEVDNPLFKNNFVGIRYSYLSLKGKNKFLAQKMLKIINKDFDSKQLIEIHNRPYLIAQLVKENKFPISMFFHNDPKTMKGSKSVKEREYILNKCVAVFCVSEYIKNLFLEGIYNNKHKVHVLYNGIQKKLKKFPKKKKEILYVGRLVPEKGVHLYVDVISLIASNYADWSFGLIGSSKLGDNKNSQLYASNLINKFTNIGSQANFYGFKDHEFVQKKMQSTSIMVIPSIWNEPFGLVAAEAMSNGVATISSKVGGLPEIIKDNGILIENINSFKLKKAVISLIEDVEKRNFFQKRAWNNFDLTSNNSSKKLDKFREVILKNNF